MEQAVEFLRRIYSGFDHDGVFTIIHIGKWEWDEDADEFKKRKRADVRVFRHHLSEIETLDWTTHIEANLRKVDIYFGSALRHPDFLNTRGSSRGGVEACVLSTCLALDIDFLYPGAHESEKLPAGLEDVESIVDLGPSPSIMINSGYGVHCYWIYNEDVAIDGKKSGKEYGVRRKQAHAPYVAAMKDRGWQCDPTFTPDRIWRLPGFQNWKIPTESREVVVLYGTGEDEDIEKHDLDKLAPPRKKKTKTEATKGTFKKSVGSVQKADSVEGLKKSLNAYAEKYYDDSLEAAQSSDVDDQEAAEDLLQKSNYIKRLLAGESIEEKGNRDFALTKVAGIISYLTPDIEEYTEAELEYIVADLMLGSLEAWVADSEDDTDIEREMEKAIDKLTRIKSKDQENQRAGLKNLARVLRRDRRPGSPPNSEGVSGEDTEEGEEGVAELLRCGLIIFGEFTWVWDWPKGRYYKRFCKGPRDLKSVIRDCWPEDDASCPFKHSFVDEEGKAVEIASSQLERIYARAAEHSYYSFCVDQTCFDYTERELIINKAPYRYTEPVFNEDINEWLRLLGGESHYNTLCDWLAGLTHLDRPCAALYLDGPPGCGKSLFGLGAAQLWSPDVPLYETIARNFNQTILKGPVSLIDEGLATDSKNASMVLRRLIAQGSHSVNWKSGPLLHLVGYLRFVIAANNDEVLLSGREEKLSENDARAMSERIIYVKIRDDRARDMFIKRNQDDVLTNQWIKGGGFAKHVLWLGENRDLSGRGRFLVQGNTSEMRNKFLFQGDERNQVLEWVVRFSEAPAKLQARVAKGLYAAEIGNGVVALNIQRMKERWSEFSGGKDPLEHSHLLRHMKALSSRQKAVKVWTDAGSARYWVIPIELMLEYAETHDIGDIDRIKEFAQRDTEITLKILGSKQSNSGT